MQVLISFINKLWSDKQKIN